MARYPLNLPQELKREAEEYAQQQGVSLNQFILWSVAEKVGQLRQSLDDPNFPEITYRRGSSGAPMPVVRGTGIRVQTLVIASENWGMGLEEIADNYDLSERTVQAALDFYAAHRAEIDANITLEQTLQDEQALA
ncbi:MAG TPA: DUF433 domain-containing protein [Anaerolineales bacterium]|nr:DUF433 domain-containing protein [Anaerolineales bacterium]